VERPQGAEIAVATPAHVSLGAQSAKIEASDGAGWGRSFTRYVEAVVCPREPPTMRGFLALPGPFMYVRPVASALVAGFFRPARACRPRATRLSSFRPYGCRALLFRFP
jgi:hypothetical protein